MEASELGRQGKSDIGRECRKRMLAWIRAHEGVVITDEQVRHCSAKTYRLTYRCYLAVGAAEETARTAAVELALEAVAWLGRPPTTGAADD